MVWVIIGVSIGVGFFMVWALKKIQVSQVKQVLVKFKDKEILAVTSSANFFGQESEGLTQIRGNGVLLLTQDEVYFKMWVVQKVIHIPISQIERVETPRSYLKRSKSLPLLKIVFKGQDGQIDSVAWYVNNLIDWQRAIKKLTSVSIA